MAKTDMKLKQDVEAGNHMANLRLETYTRLLDRLIQMHGNGPG